LDAPRLALRAVTGWGIEPLAGPTFVLPPGVGLVWAGLVVAGVVVVGGDIARRWSSPAARSGLIVLAWFLAPALLFLWQWTPIYIHYFIAGLPAGCLLAGVAFGRALAWLGARRGLQLAAWAALLLTVGLQLLGWGGLMRAVATNPLGGGFGVPLGTKLAAADAARRLMAETGAAETLLAGDGSDPEEDDFPAEFRALLHDVPVRYVDLNAEAVFPAAATVVLLGPALADEPTTTRDLYTAAAGTMETLAAGGTTVYTVHALLPAAAPPPDVTLPAPALLANFTQVAGHNALRPGPDGALWDVFWRTADNPDPADYHIFNHLLDAGGARVAQADGAAFAGAQWRAGDVVVSRFLLPPAPDAAPLTMRVGMYRFPSLEAVPVLDEAANPVGEAVELPLE
jgi:hypothetical protein